MQKNNQLFFIFSFGLLALLGAAYYFSFHPIYYTNGIKHYNSYFLQGDAINYLNYAKIEIAGKSFFEWYLKLEKENIGLLYFSWMNSVLAVMNVPELGLCFLFILTGYYFMYKIVQSGEFRAIFSWFSILTSFSMVIFMQSFTKEIFIFPLLILAIRSIQTKNLKLGIFSLFFLLMVRVYFSMIFIFSYLLFSLIKRGHKVSACVFLIFLVFFMPYLFTDIFTSFSVLRNLPYGLSRLYILTLNYSIMYVFWLPFKIIQNIIEPIILVSTLKISQFIAEPAAILDFLTSVSIFLHIGVFLKLIRHYKTATELTQFLIILSAMFLFIVASTPIVHFRYIVPILPIFGLIIDQLLSKSKSRAT